MTHNIHTTRVLPEERNDGAQNVPIAHKQFIHAKKTYYFGLTCLHGSFVLAAIIIYAVTMTSFAYAPIIPFLAFPFFVNSVKNYFKLQAAGNIPKSPECLDLSPEKFNLPALNHPSNLSYRAKISSNSTESNGWKLELIKNAEQNIFLSGSYCGGEIFDQALRLIEEKMQQKPHLKTFIISSDFYLTNDNREHLQSLQSLFPDRFHLHVFSENNTALNPLTDQWIVSVIHAKICAIDFGKYFITGGSGLQTKWVSSEEDSRENSESRFRFPRPSVQPNYMNDIDFLFHSDSDRGVGGTLYLEMIKLFFMFDTKKQNLVDGQFPSYTQLSFPEESIMTSVPNLEFSTENPMEITPFFSGPGQPTNPFLEKIIERIDAAQTSIVMNNMYFHPSQRLLNALADASRRGVKVTIITNDQHQQSPGSHRFFADLSKKQALRLFDLGEAENIDVWLYRKQETTHHKKVIIIDNEYTMIGSSNICYRSDQTDFEVNLEIKSREFAENTGKLNRNDQESCAQFTRTERLFNPSSSYTGFKGAFQHYVFSTFL